MVAVTSLKIEHGIIAPVIPAIYVNKAIKIPDNHVWSISDCPAFEYIFKKIWINKTKKTKFPNSECNLAVKAPCTDSHQRVKIPGTPISNAKLYKILSSKPVIYWAAKIQRTTEPPIKANREYIGKKATKSFWRSMLYTLSKTYKLNSNNTS